MKAVVFSLGCKVNQCESASLIQGLRQNGWEATDELGYADLYIINTCAVTVEAEKKSRQMIARVLKWNKDAEIIVTGCASEKSPQVFYDRANVTVVTGTRSKDKILELIDKNGIFIEKNDEYYEKYLPCGGLRTRSYVKVQDGCNNFCSYCIIPYLRGRSRSRAVENIKREIEELRPTEVVLTGINLSDYNYQGLHLPDLLLELKEYDTRIRLGSLEVGVIDEKLLKATKELKDFAPHFHLSLQSGSDAVLKAMNRKYTIAGYEAAVELIRKFYPDAAITTDIIVGYSTENISDFKQSILLAERVRFSDIHCFAYSKREGTRGALLKELPAEEKKNRLAELMEVKQRLKDNFISANLNSVQEFIPEEICNEYVCGYTGNYIRAYIKNAPLEGKYKIILKKKYEDGVIAELV